MINRMLRRLFILLCILKLTSLLGKSIKTKDFWDEVSKYKPVQIAEETGKIIAKTLCGNALILDNKERWSYIARPGIEISQLHVKNQEKEEENSEKSTQINTLGSWNPKRCAESIFPDMSNKLKKELHIDGRIARSLIPVTNVRNGFLKDWKIAIGNKKYEIILKASDNLFLLQYSPLSSPGNFPYKLIEGDSKIQSQKWSNIVGKFIYCDDCAFISSFSKRLPLYILTDYGLELRRIKRFLDETLIEIDRELIGTEIEYDQIYQLTEKSEKLHFTKMPGKIIIQGSLLYGENTEFSRIGDLNIVFILPKSIANDDFIVKPKQEILEEDSISAISFVLKVVSNDAIILEYPVYPLEYSPNEEFKLYYLESAKYEEPLLGLTFWNPYCPSKMIFFDSEEERIKFPEISSCFTLLTEGSGVILFEIPDADIYIPTISLSFLSSEYEILFHLYLGLNNGSLNALSSEINQDIAAFNKKIYTSLTHFWIVIYNENFYFGTGKKLGSGLKIRYKHSSLKNINSFLLGVKGEATVKNMKVMDVEYFVQELFDELNLIPTLDHFSSFYEHLEDGDSDETCKRTTKVEYLCGEEYEMVEADEVSPCRYIIKLTTPYICPKNWVNSHVYKTGISLKRYTYVEVNDEIDSS
ncbi:unnamed protein product [Blepharisma stoltei]|uniref:MRH domain-containing protein n=1 Tax=Blepharisma stoltei TaxID=1481888 RepID=A0AAU9K277_9CILI|nr:unnamed protein product [Blepharisma stoltei]